MKIGILDVVSGPLSKMLNSLTEAGRLMNALRGNNGEQGSGNTKVDQQLNKLRGSNYKQFYYNKVVGNYTKQINDLQAQINNGGKKPGAGSGTSQDVRYLTAQKQSFEVMLGLFRSGAKDIMQPVSDTKPLPVEVKNPTGGGGGSKNSIANIGQFSIPDIDPESLKQHEKPIEHTSLLETIGEDNLRKYFGMPMGEQTRDWGKELGKVFANYIEDPDKNKRNKQDRDDDRRQEAIYGNISHIAGSVQGMLSTLEQMGIEIPDELKSMVSGVQSIMEFMSAMTALVSTIAGTSTIKALPIIGTFAHNGAVIHAAGGAVTGNTYSGDKIPAMLNAGEVVLNRAQTGNIASQLSGNNGGGQNAQPFVTGDIIYLGLQNYLQENGYGKLMTTNMR
jgi:hypothetical protein